MMRFWRFHLGSFILKAFTGTIILCVISCWILWIHVSVNNRPETRHHSVVFTTEKCNNPPRLDSSTLHQNSKFYDFSRNFTSFRSQRKVLIIYKHTSIVFRMNMVTILESNRIPYHSVYITDKTVLPSLEENSVGKYAVVVFESLKFYTELSTRSRRVLERYCHDFSAGLVLFTGHENYGYFNYYSKRLKLRLQTGIKDIKYVELNRESSLLRLTRAGGIVEGDLPSQWTVFSSNHSTHEYVEIATQETIFLYNNINELNADASTRYLSKKYITVMLDKGDMDGVKRVYFGGGINFWLHRLIFIDSLSFLSNGKIETSLQRWFLVDIDDIFVGRTGIRLTKEDVKALIFVQKRINSRVPGFKFNLGFSGYHYLRGSEEEKNGDKELIKNADKFWWFSHMWTHRKAHQIKTLQDIKDELMLNLDFAKKHNIPINTSYAVAPHHSGVYPVHNLLYDSWKVHYNLKVTSTEEYPHLIPAYQRRGFIYKGIKVLPRQTCGLYTKTILLKDYPKGSKRLENSIYGGELFQLFVDNPINLFMTHMSNYGNDRLALHTFENVVKYLQCWTNLKLRTEHPLVLADMYFKLFPEDKMPLWQNPCNDKRHLSIWEPEKSCYRLPSVLIIGPQKTGTTALYQYLSMHPEFISNEMSLKTYEEVQFFNGLNYLKGLDWYMDFFPDIGNTSKNLLFEKSANYFDSPLAPLRAATLLPKAKIISILIDPVKRAYSWYQHVKSHGKVAAVKHSFYDVLTKGNTSKNREFRVLGHRCLIPGLYAQHLERWLMHYPPSQILVIDGSTLKNDPAEVMLEVQQFLGVTIYDYNSKLRFDKRKGFYCLVTSNGSHKCLGKSKGRHYPPIDNKSKEFLEKYYKESNDKLASLLLRIRKPLPSWLTEKA